MDANEEEDVVIRARRAKQAIDDRVELADFRDIVERFPEEERTGHHLNQLIKYAIRSNWKSLGQLEPNIIRFLIEQDAECAKIVDGFGDLLLHTACEYEAPFDIIQYLLELNPDAVHTTDRRGQLPLHRIFEWRFYSCVDTAELLLERFPGSVRITDKDGRLPLHIALRSKPHEGIIMRLLECYPESAGIATGFDDNKELPIHIACGGGVPLEVIQRLVKLYPVGIRTKDISGALALHHACHYRSILDWQRDVVEFLIQLVPDSVSVVDKLGRLPLHYAAQSGTFELVEVLLEHFPAGVMVLDTDGMLPLHHACLNDELKNVRQVRLLIDHYPDALKVPDKSKSLPLHYHVERVVDSDDELALELMLEHHPNAVHACDDNGRLPLHRVCETVIPSLDCIRLLVDVDPYTVVAKTNALDTPLEFACCRRYLIDTDSQVRIRSYLLEKQTSVAEEIREAITIETEKHGLPDVHALIWEFAKPGLYQPSREEITREE